MLAASAGPAHQHVDLGGVLRQEHRRLAGRVAAADQRHLRAARTCLASSAEAQYQMPRPSNSARRGTAGPAVARAAGDHDGARAQAPAVGERDGAARRRCSARAAVERRDLRRDQHLGAELLRLHDRRGRPARRRRCRSESPGSSRCARWRRPGRRRSGSRARSRAGLPRRRTRRSPGRPGRRRPRPRRTGRRARRVSTMPRQRASAFSVGLSSTEPSGQTTSSSPAAAPYCSSSAAASASCAGVDHVVGMAVAAQEVLQPQQRRPTAAGRSAPGRWRRLRSAPRGAGSARAPGARRGRPRR